uniref:Peptidase_M13 domain-containing protein n=1 Tax=Bursaphelenchus xylophilus TaxID=6326 RepID=A0A1I7RWZ7_BURXY
MVSPSQAMVLSKIVSPSEPGPSKSSFKQELMEKMMNSTADPCKDFFEYAAGQADEVYVPTTMYDDIRSLLMDLSLAYQIESIQKIRKVYTDCLVKPQYEDPTSIETWVMKAVNKFPDIQFPIDEKAPIMTNFTAYIALVPVDTTNFTVMMPDILTESPDLDDAQHSRLTNGNFFTWGYFEYPKYDSAWSPVMHFSSLAFVMAHELGHNFELLNVTSPEHEATTECIIHFYSKQCDPKRPRCLMSAKTYFEDFPDQLVSKHSTKTFSGIRWAYSAYRRYSLSRPLEPRPRGRNLDKFNDDQLFFLNLAQNMASFPGWDDYSFNNNHSPNSVRIWGSMANFPAFGSAFSCPVGSNYNPRLKCPIFNMPTKPDFNLSSRNISLA